MENILLRVNKIPYYKNQIKSGMVYHITSGHQTVMGKLRLFLKERENPSTDGEFLEDLSEYQNNPTQKAKYEVFALLELETPLLASMDAVIICSKLDTDLEANVCRFALWGRVLESYAFKDLAQNVRIFRIKKREGKIEKVVDSYTLLIKDLFKKETNISLFIGKSVIIPITGNEGKIEGSFGKSGKVKVHFSKGVAYQVNRINISNKEQN